MPRITISYRREDSGVIAGRIFDRLVAQYGREAIFRDIDDVPIGVDFREHIGRVLDASDIVLAIVSPSRDEPRSARAAAAPSDADRRFDRRPSRDCGGGRWVFRAGPAELTIAGSGPECRATACQLAVTQRDPYAAADRSRAGVLAVE